MSERGAEIRYRLRLAASAEEVYERLATDGGRAGFWAERTEQKDDEIVFFFADGEKLISRVLESSPPHRLSLTYFNGSIVTFDVHEQSAGTEVQLLETNLTPSDESQNRAGWVSVLMNLKAQADHGIDLRNHSPDYVWSKGYVEN